MIAPQELNKCFEIRPFRPFRIHMASGDTFEIRHPEMGKVGKNFLLLFTFVSESPELLDRWEAISLMLMERVSLIDAPSAHDANGAGG